jgi:hypothetical protein
MNNEWQRCPSRQNGRSSRVRKLTPKPRMTAPSHLRLLQVCASHAEARQRDADRRQGELYGTRELKKGTRVLTTLGEAINTRVSSAPSRCLFRITRCRFHITWTVFVNESRAAESAYGRSLFAAGFVGHSSLFRSQFLPGHFLGSNADTRGARPFPCGRQVVVGLGLCCSGSMCQSGVSRMRISAYAG